MSSELSFAFALCGILLLIYFVLAFFARPRNGDR